MEKDAHYFTVGLFVTIGFFLLAGFVVWLTGTHDTRRYDRYTIYFMDPVSGLQEGASVQYKGIKVGKVMEARLSPARADLIKVDIEIDHSTPIRAGTRAALASQGITGLVYIELTTSPEDTTPPPRYENEKYPVIKGSGTQLSKLFQDVPAISKQVLELTERLNTLFDDNNAAKLDQTLTNLENMTRDLNGLLSDENVSLAATSLHNVATATESLPELIGRLENTAAEMEEASATINKVVSDNASNISSFSRDGLDEITAMSKETRRMAEAVRRIADKLADDPSQVIYQPNYRGVEVEK
jgi:phospholipid/cholesterol/gamma-HCH transport system substrate-binding protein